MIDYLIYISSLITVFKPEVINTLELTQLDNVLSVILVSNIFVLIYKLNGKIKKKQNKYLLLTLLFWGVCLIPTILYFQNIRGIVVLILRTILLGLMCYHGTIKRNRYKKLIFSSAFVFAGQMILNQIFIWLLPYGSFTTPSYNLAGVLVYNYMLGPKNNITTFALTGVLLVAIFEIEYRSKIGIITALYVLLCMYTMYSVKCSTGLLLFVLIAAILTFRIYRLFYIKGIRKISLLMLSFGILAVMAISIIASDDFMQQITHSRWIIWIQAIILIIKKPILGYGMQLDHDLIYLYGSYRYSHNEILEILLYGGIVALSIYFFILTKILKEIKPLQKEFRQLFALYMITYFLAQLFESKFVSLYIFYVIFLFGSICYENKSMYKSNKITHIINRNILGRPS